MRTLLTRWIRCRRAMIFTILAFCCAGAFDNFSPPCRPIPENIQIQENDTPCCFDRNWHRFSFVNRSQLSHYNIDAWPQTCCFADEPYREYHYFMTEIIEQINHIRDSLYKQYVGLNIERPANYDSMTIPERYEYNQKEHNRYLLRKIKRDSAYCTIVDSLETSWLGPQYQKFDIPAKTDCRVNVLKDIRNDCNEWISSGGKVKLVDTVYHREVPKRPIKEIKGKDTIWAKRSYECFLSEDEKSEICTHIDWENPPIPFKSYPIK